MKREDIEKLLGWAREAQKIFKKSGETDFEELRRKERQEIFDALIDTCFEYDTDGDCDGAYMSYEIDNVSIRFGAHSESCYPEDMRNALDYMIIAVDYEKVSPSHLIDYLDHVLNAGVEIVNLTPHEITVYDVAGESILQVIPSSGMARAAQTREPLDSINGIPVSKTGYGAVEGLPDQRDGVVYIVSVLTAQAASDRTDLYITDELVRDDTGRILGCKALAQI